MTTIITKWQWFSFQGLSIIQTLECSHLATSQIYQPLLSVITVINKEVHRHTPCSCLDSLLFIMMRENALRCEMSGMWQLGPLATSLTLCDEQLVTIFMLLISQGGSALLSPRQKADEGDTSDYLHVLSLRWGCAGSRLHRLETR